ncbi:MAG: hypothetical protein Q8N16_01970 [bacterium]|nr:hypothetical protein [bacterium]
MIRREMPSRHLLKARLLLTSIGTLAVILLFNFVIFPEMKKTLIEIIPEQVKTIEAKLLYATIAFSAFILLINFYSWNLINKLTWQENRIKQALLENPEDQTLKDKLIEISNREDRYLTLIEPIFMIVLGAMIGFFSITAIQPLYSLLNAL